MFLLFAGTIGNIQLSCSSHSKQSTPLPKEQSNASTSSLAEIPTVEFCQLLKGPFLYESKLIRSEGT